MRGRLCGCLRLGPAPGDGNMLSEHLLNQHPHWLTFLTAVQGGQGGVLIVMAGRQLQKTHSLFGPGWLKIADRHHPGPRGHRAWGWWEGGWGVLL